MISNALKSNYSGSLIKKTLFLAISLFYLSICAFAKGGTDAVIKVPYRQAPHRVYALTPSNGQSIFYGQWNSQGQRFSLHLYRIRGTKKETQLRETATYKVDLFQLNGTGKHTRYQLVNSVTLSEVESFSSVSIDQLWLDPLKKSMPLLDLSLLYTDFYGPQTNSRLLVFTQGWKKPPFIQKFEAHANNNEGYGYGYDINVLDERGYLIIESNYWVQENRERTNLFWDGREFAPKGTNAAKR